MKVQLNGKKNSALLFARVTKTQKDTEFENKGQETTCYPKSNIKRKK